MVSYLIDAFLAAMLVTTTVYMVVVNRRLRVLRDGQSEMSTLIASFSRNIDVADASVRRLVGSATEVAAALGDAVEKGTAMKDEVGLLLGSCERTVARLDESRRHAQQLLKRLDEGFATRAPRAMPETRPSLVPDPRPAPELRPPPDLRAVPDTAEAAVPAAEVEAPLSDEEREKARAALREALLRQADAPAEAEGQDGQAAPFREIFPADLTAQPRSPERESRLGAGQFYASLRTLVHKG